MEARKLSSSEISDLVISQQFHFQVTMVWDAWTDPQEFKKWWGPKNFTCPYSEIDFRIGGTYLHCMRSPDGSNYWTTGVFKGIEPLKKIICTDSFSDDLGNVVPASYYGMKRDFPLALLVTLEFEASNGGTKLTLTHSGLLSDEVKKITQSGWIESFEKLRKALI